MDLLARHAQNPSAFLALNSDTRIFSVPGVDGAIAYRPAGRRFLIQFGGVFAAPSEQGILLREFLDFGRESKRRTIAVQLTPEDTRLYAELDFTVNQFGSDYARRLDGFNVAGKKYVQLRNKVSRARREGLQVVEVGTDDVDAVDVTRLDQQLDALDKSWLRAKGRHVRELAFMVGERDGAAAGLRRLFVALKDGDPLAYVSFSPVYGERAGWLHDLSRRAPDAPPGALELIVLTAVERFRAEGAAHLHFGFTPFVGLSQDHECAARSKLVSRVIRLIADHGTGIYPAATQVAYKEKWGPDIIEPEYLAFQGGVSVRAVWSLLRLTNIV